MPGQVYRFSSFQLLVAAGASAVAHALVVLLEERRYEFVANQWGEVGVAHGRVLRVG